MAANLFPKVKTTKQSNEIYYQGGSKNGVNSIE